MTFDSAPDVLNVEEVAALLRIGRNGAYDLVKSGVLRSVRIGRRIVVAKSSLLSFLQGREDA
jgi:excisionase family DNA binding protein